MARLLDDASTEYLSYSSAIISSAPWSFSGWIYPNDGASNGRFFALGHTSTFDYWYGLIAGNDGDVLRLRVNEGTGSNCDTSNSVTLNAWNHVALIEAAADDRTTVLNGDWSSRGTNSASRTPEPNRTYIGDGVITSTPFSGGVAEFGVWDVALTQGEIESLNAGVAPISIRPESLVAYWRLLDDDGDVDHWGQYDLTPVNTPSFMDHPPITSYSGIPLPYVVPVSAGGTIDISVNSCDHSHTADEPGVTQTHEIASNECGHAHTADEPSITQTHEIAPQEALHGHTVDEPAVDQTISIVPADCDHSHAADEPSVTQTHQISSDGADHGHTADNVTITVGGVSISVDDCDHDHSADQPAITQTHVVAADDADHAHSADNVTISVNAVAIAVDDADHAHAVDSPAITQTHVVITRDALHAHLSDSPAITQIHAIIPAECLHAHSCDSPTVSAGSTFHNFIVLTDPKLITSRGSGTRLTLSQGESTEFRLG